MSRDTSISITCQACGKDLNDLLDNDWWMCETCGQYFHKQCYSPTPNFRCNSCAGWHSPKEQLPAAGEFPPFSDDVLTVLSDSTMFVAAFDTDSGDWVIPWGRGTIIPGTIIAWRKLPAYLIKSEKA